MNELLTPGHNWCDPKASKNKSKQIIPLNKNRYQNPRKRYQKEALYLQFRPLSSALWKMELTWFSNEHRLQAVQLLLSLVLTFYYDSTTGYSVGLNKHN